MDYLEIILRGYFNDANRAYLDKYFIQVFKKAERDFFIDAEVFFSGLESQVSKMKRNLENRMNNRKGELTFLLTSAQNNTLKYNNVFSDKSIEDLHNETIENCKKALELININDFDVDLGGISNNIHTGSLRYDQVSIIENEIQKAKLKVRTPNDLNKPPLTINQIALKYVYEESQITRDNGNGIAEKYGHKSGEKLFQRYTYYSSRANRIGNSSTKIKINNKIMLIESVITLLHVDNQQRPKDELTTLKSKLKSDSF
jgi:hypothetical protein